MLLCHNMIRVCTKVVVAQQHSDQHPHLPPWQLSPCFEGSLLWFILSLLCCASALPLSAMPLPFNRVV